MKKLREKITNNSKKIIFSSFCVIACVAIALSLVLGGMRIAYNIKINGKVVNTVGDKQTYYSALDLVAEIVEGDNVKDVLPEAQIDTVITINTDFDNCNDVADSIINNTDSIVLASRLIVDGAVVGCADPDSLSDALSARKEAYSGIEGGENNCDFCADVRLESGYYLEDEVSDISELIPAVSSLDVKTVTTVSVEEEVPFDTVTNKNSNYDIGYTRIVRNGENGVNLVTYGVVYINGEKTEATTKSVEVIKEPVTEIIEVGTASKKVKLASGKTNFIFPLPSGTWEISCHYGKDGHKGVDLRAEKGTAIMAVEGGTVISAGYDGSYGNCVVIDHGNGISTLYAHASRICVNVGDKVSAGDVIALVGSTGYSTGYHLHFEVHIGSNRVNPQPYIGL